jgi:hypothetical protein
VHGGILHFYSILKAVLIIAYFSARILHKTHGELVGEGQLAKKKR